MSKYLVVNLGLKSMRIIVFNEKGEQIFVRSKPVFSNLSNKKVEQNSNEWKKDLLELMSELKATPLANEIMYVTSTTSSSCIYGVDKMGASTTPVMMVSDKRSEQQVQRIVNSNIFRRKKVRHGFSCSTSSTIPKISWYKDNHQELFDRTYKWLGAGEFINYFFTNEFVTDPLNAGKAFYDGSQYDNELLNFSNLSDDILPEVVPIGTSLSITKDVLLDFGLNKECKYIITTYDAICAVIGSYDGSKNTACDVSGTVTSVRILTDEVAQIDDSLPVLSQELGIENKRLIGASNNMGGGIIEWYKQAFYDESNKNVYYTMENQASSSSTGANGIIFLPYLLGERAPFKSLNAKASFFGVSRSSSLEDFSRAVFESTAFVTNDLLNLSINAGLDIDCLSVSGGLARFDLINQIKADVTNKQVKVLENFESTSVGAFILLALSINKYNSFIEASINVVRIRKIINPNTKNHDIYKSYFEFFKDLNNTLLNTYNKHAIILDKIENYKINKLSNL